MLSWAVVRRSRLHALLGCAAVALTLDAAAQENAKPSASDRAQQLFDGGVKDMLAGRYERGCASIAESHKIDPRPGTVFTLAECHARAGKLASALRSYALYLALVEVMPEEQSRAHRERAAIARAERNRLNPQVPKLTVSWSGAPPPGASVALDGVVLDEMQMRRPQAVDPGEHVVTYRDARGRSGERRVTISQDQSARVVLPSPAGPTPNARGPALPDRKAEAAGPSSARRSWTYLIGGVGIAGLVLGSVTGTMALMRKKNEVDEHCEDVSADVVACDEQGLSAAESGQSLALTSTIAFAVGIAGLGTAATLLLTEPKAAPVARFGRWHVGASGSPRAGGAHFSFGGSF
jgi:hypothetical protein